MPFTLGSYTLKHYGLVNTLKHYGLVNTLKHYGLVNTLKHYGLVIYRELTDFVLS
jgi:hypothetical protein